MTPEITEVSVSFGDCDPAGIVFYPNILRWSDAAFHTSLRKFGGHAKICKMLGAVGIGLIESNIRFETPLRDGDVVVVETQVTEWGRRTLTVTHVGTMGGRKAFHVTEVRCLFKATENGIVADEVAALREILGGA